MARVSQQADRAGLLRSAREGADDGAHTRERHGAQGQHSDDSRVQEKRDAQKERSEQYRRDHRWQREQHERQHDGNDQDYAANGQRGEVVEHARAAHEDKVCLHLFRVAERAARAQCCPSGYRPAISAMLPCASVPSATMPSMGAMIPVSTIVRHDQRQFESSISIISPSCTSRGCCLGSRCIERAISRCIVQVQILQGRRVETKFVELIKLQAVERLHHFIPLRQHSASVPARAACGPA